MIARDNDSRRENIRLQQWQDKLYSKQADVDCKEQENKEQAYSIYKSIFSKTYCKNTLINEYGKDYWIGLIKKMYELGQEIGKSEIQVKIEGYLLILPSVPIVLQHLQEHMHLTKLNFRLEHIKSHMLLRT